MDVCGYLVGSPPHHHRIIVVIIVIIGLLLPTSHCMSTFPSPFRKRGDRTSSKHPFERNPRWVFPKIGVGPQNGWFISWKTLFFDGWFGGFHHPYFWFNTQMFSTNRHPAFASSGKVVAGAPQFPASPHVAEVFLPGHPPTLLHWWKALDHGGVPGNDFPKVGCYVFLFLRNVKCPNDESTVWCTKKLLFRAKRLVVVSNIFYVHPYLGNWSNLTNIFEMGCNHQPENFVVYYWISLNTYHWSGSPDVGMPENQYP